MPNRLKNKIHTLQKKVRKNLDQLRRVPPIMTGLPEPQMTRQGVIKLAKELGWKTWGKSKAQPGNDSKYQCFRHGSHYAWVGSYFVEVNTSQIAHDYVSSTPEKTRKFLTI